MNIGRHLRALRRETGLSRAELARRAGVPVSTLRHWENGRGFPGIPRFLRLAEALGVPAERLAEGVDDPAEEEAEPARAMPQRVRKGTTSSVPRLPPISQVRDTSWLRDRIAERAGRGQRGPGASAPGRQLPRGRQPQALPFLTVFCLTAARGAA